MHWRKSRSLESYRAHHPSPERRPDCCFRQIAAFSTPDWHGASVYQIQAPVPPHIVNNLPGSGFDAARQS